MASLVSHLSTKLGMCSNFPDAMFALFTDHCSHMRKLMTSPYRPMKVRRLRKPHMFFSEKENWTDSWKASQFSCCYKSRRILLAQEQLLFLATRGPVARLGDDLTLFLLPVACIVTVEPQQRPGIPRVLGKKQSGRQ